MVIYVDFSLQEVCSQETAGHKTISLVFCGQIYQGLSPGPQAQRNEGPHGTSHGVLLNPQGHTGPPNADATPPQRLSLKLGCSKCRYSKRGCIKCRPKASDAQHSSDRMLPPVCGNTIHGNLDSVSKKPAVTDAHEGPERTRKLSAVDGTRPCKNGSPEMTHQLSGQKRRGLGTPVLRHAKRHRSGGHVLEEAHEVYQMQVQRCSPTASSVPPRTDVDLQNAAKAIPRQCERGTKEPARQRPLILSEQTGEQRAGRGRGRGRKGRGRGRGGRRRTVRFEEFVTEQGSENDVQNVSKVAGDELVPDSGSENEEPEE